MGMRANLGFAAAIAAFAMSSASANAAELMLDTTYCAATNAAFTSGGCKFDNGNIGNAGMNAAAQTLYNADLSGKSPKIDLSNFLGQWVKQTGIGFGDVTVAGNSLSGTWATPGYSIDYLAVKAGNDFILYYVGGVSSGDWSTINLFTTTGGPHPKNVQNGLSHLAFFGTPTGAVPEPASWAMMILGLGSVGFAMRRRPVARKVSFS